VNARSGNVDRICVLVAFEEQYSLYRETVARLIRDLRPHVDVRVAKPDALGEAVTRFDPIMVVCNRPNTVSPNGRPAWFELRPESDRSALLCINGEYWWMPNPAFEELLSAIDEAEELARMEKELGGC
jgi:hypothetical protein